MADDGQPQNPARRNLLGKAVKGTGAALLTGTALTTYALGKSAQLNYVKKELPEQVQPDFTSHNFPTLKAANSATDKYGEMIIEATAGMAAAYPVALAAKKISDIRASRKLPEPPKETRREFLKSATEMVSDAALLGTGAMVVYNATQYHEAEQMKADMPSDVPPVERVKIERVLKNGQDENTGLIGNNVLLGLAAAAISHSEREARRRDSHLGIPNERG